MILLMGVAGAGKSMQGRILADEYGYAWISTGEILRVLVTGKRRQDMLNGKLLSDIEIVELLDRVFELINTHEEFMLDGFPRTIPQADWLMRQVQKKRFDLTAIINLVATEEVVKDRLLKRGRPDDTKEAIERRFEEYEAVTKPIVDHFREEGVQVHDINADRSPQEVHDDIIKLLDHPKPLAAAE